MVMEIMSMATLKSSVTLDERIKAKSTTRQIILSPDLPNLVVKYEFEGLREMRDFSVTVRLKATGVGDWYYFDEGVWQPPYLYAALTVTESHMTSFMGFELVLEELEELVTKAFYDRYHNSTLIYKERDVERSTEIHPPFEVFPVA